MDAKEIEVDEPWIDMKAVWLILRPAAVVESAIHEVTSAFGPDRTTDSSALEVEHFTVSVVGGGERACPWNAGVVVGARPRCNACVYIAVYRVETELALEFCQNHFTSFIDECRLRRIASVPRALEIVVLRPCDAVCMPPGIDRCEVCVVIVRSVK